MEAKADAPVKKVKEVANTSSQEAKKPQLAQIGKSRPPKKPKSVATTQPTKVEANTVKGKASSTAISAASNAPAAGGTSAIAKRKRRKREAADQNAAGDSKGRDGSGGAAEDPVGKFKLKVVVRKLPPNVPEAIFWKAVSPWIILPRELVKEQGEGGTSDDAKANVHYAYFVQGKLKDGSRRGVNNDSSTSHHTSSRAYIHFISIDALIAFHKGFNGHLFKDSKGNESIATVEFAPFQRMPSEIVRKKKIDSRQGTIEDDADYKSFIISLEEKKADANGLSQAEKTDAQLMGQLISSSTQTTISAEKAKHTPLLDHIRAQHSAKAGSSALKNARSYLNRNNNAYAAATGKGGSGSAAMKPSNLASKDKSKAKGKGKVKPSTQAQASPANADPSIPTGPKALRMSEGKSAIKPQASNQQQQNSDVTKSAPPKGPKVKANNTGGGGTSKTKPTMDSKAAPALSTKDGEKASSTVMPTAMSQSSIPTGPSADRGGVTRGRGGGRRGGKGRGGSAPIAASNGNR